MRYETCKHEFMSMARHKEDKFKLDATGLFGSNELYLFQLNSRSVTHTQTHTKTRRYKHIETHKASSKYALRTLAYKTHTHTCIRQVAAASEPATKRSDT